MTERLSLPPGITYSHGGPGELPSYPAKPGDTTGAGNPIEVWRAMGGGLNWPAFVVLSSGTITVDVQGSLGPPLGDGTLDESSWFSFHTFSLTAGQADSITCPAAFPYVRSKITARSSGALVSGVGPIVIAPGKVVKAQHPTLRAGGSG